MGQLDGKTALVTGGTSGIGHAAAKRLVQEGAYVFITGRDRTRAEKAAASIGAHGVQSDVSNPDELDALAAEIAEYGKGLDVVFANAGGGDYATLAEVTPQHYRDNIDRNVGGTVFTVQKILPLLNDGASIILTGSTAPAKGTPAFGLYAASKAAIRSLGRTWAAELVDRNIRVNTVIPGPIRTPGLEGLAPDGQRELDGWAAQVPMKRLGDPDEIATAVLFLASNQSSFMTGAELVVDGGQIQI
ncbi:SDR family NAD(P)-dependent oxidoreductase [Mycolicibacterium smegmatis]|uniref:Short-chain dehydrogenase/reductase SDR n=2 Tax=Mycolicibacterium smegmatis (strain ATCC 700084 / mc(2)155) TaxID=246196 RepID=A0R789_MYCS2|nr:SDR family oxidoreductase [Mycolicibacterium smegmatis]ABK73899.1 short-chain dehydrogenase/reductase SDR [Mycolicibacterium smegmatis MC2 155]AFP43068.1 Short-chain dehydrogenase/reductase SDR [Mycolicibacterium smegmatis MC2 155]AIU11785.1 short-chain dehydrogenase [Mycolicibacterium smegmatis MC2 155]AIU18410.1 short-chain dehydrogenase [Mycolicibacterium smegmatis]AIU25032.1 short-chain dehydrogenase [Mycolicibacterium smegmatis]